MPACPNCGHENPPGARYCSNCGTRLRAPEPVHDERKLVSVLFVDLVDFTARSDRADPEDVREILSVYQASVRDCIEAFGGRMEKFIGDAVMAVFGAPISHGDDAERAVRAGLRVLSRIEQLNLERPGLDLSVHAAVNTGEAVVRVGTRADSGEPLATGDVVNTASRLQSAARPGELIVGEEIDARRHLQWGGARQGAQAVDDLGVVFLAPVQRCINYPPIRGDEVLRPVFAGIDLAVHKSADGGFKGGQAPERLAYGGHLIDAVCLAHPTRKDDAHRGDR